MELLISDKTKPFKAQTEAFLIWIGFVRLISGRIVVNHSGAEIFYNVPIINEKGRASKNEVLPLFQSGSPARTRTTDKLVNSQLLYRLSYWGTNTVSFRILKYR